MLKNIFSFLKSKIFLKHLIFYLVCFFLICWLIIIWLASYTSHGKTVKVPDFKGQSLLMLNDFIKDKNITFQIIDSIYDPTIANGTVVKQEPEANEDVKDGRTIYLYVTSFLPPSILMPKLVDKSLRQAMAMITSYGLKLGKIKYVPDQCVNCVLAQLSKNKTIEVGATVPKSTVINLVVGKGLGEEEVNVPCLYGLSRKDATEKLNEASLAVGAINFDEPKDSLISKVYRQTPSCGMEKGLRMGATIDLFFTTDKNKIPPMPKDSLNSKLKNDENFDE